MSIGVGFMYFTGSLLRAGGLGFVLMSLAGLVAMLPGSGVKSIMLSAVASNLFDDFLLVCVVLFHVHILCRLSTFHLLYLGAAYCSHLY